MKRRRDGRPGIRGPAAVALAVVALVAATATLARRSGERAFPTHSSVSPTTPGSSAPSTGGHGALVLHGTGDVTLDPAALPALASHGYARPWRGLDRLFVRDDLTVVNLECPATDIVAPVGKQVVYRCDPGALPAARRAGVDVVNQANNHAADQGPDGLLDSLERIRAAGLTPVGAGSSRTGALRPATFALRGWRFAVVGVDEVVDPASSAAGLHAPGTAPGTDFPLVLRALRAAAARADVVVVAIHWGVEQETEPRRYQISQAHRMIDAGADVIFGSHAHRLQPMETYRGRLIFYGLGNFVWPDVSAEASRTAVAEVTVSPAGRFTGRLLPASIASDGHPVLG